MSFDRDGLGARLDRSGLRERLDHLYVRYFVPPSVTGDAVEADSATEAVGGDDVEDFDFRAWLQAGRETGPTPPPAEPRVVTGAVTETAEPDPADFGTFDLTGWLSDGEEFGPVEGLEPATDDVPEADVDVADGTDRPLLQGPSLHPVKAATFALFLSVVALVGLTVVGYLPALGPATGLGP